MSGMAASSPIAGDSTIPRAIQTVHARWECEGRAVPDPVWSALTEPDYPSRALGTLDLNVYIRARNAVPAEVHREPPKSAAAVRLLLSSIREQLGMAVAYIAELSEAQVLRWLDGDGPSFGFELGGVSRLEDTYCHRMVRGEISSLISDAVNDFFVKDLAITDDAQIGSYVGVPIILPDGSIYGTLCVLGHAARPDLDERHVETLRLYASLIGQYLGAIREERSGHDAIRVRVAAIIARRQIRAVFQPIVRLDRLRTVGFEALARFPPPDPSPLRWFGDAETAGLRAQLEIAAASAALGEIETLPTDTYVSLNFSPAVLLELDRVDLDALGLVVPLDRLVLEVTEQAHVEDYERLAGALAQMRARGIRLAIDDAGAGFASMMHIVELRPDFIKLDISITRGIEADPSRRALASSLVEFARNTGAAVVAEGLETPGERVALMGVGVELGQGYLLGRPDAASSFTARV